MTLSEVVGRNIKVQRALKGWTQLDLSVELGLACPNISATENGKCSIRLSTLEAYANAFGVDPSVLLLHPQSAAQAFVPKGRVNPGHPSKILTEELPEAPKPVKVTLRNSLGLPILSGGSNEASNKV